MMVLLLQLERTVFKHYDKYTSVFQNGTQQECLIPVPSMFEDVIVFPLHVASNKFFTRLRYS